MIIIKLGGSILRPKFDSFDSNVVTQISKVLTQFSDHKFIVVIGGGALARKYQEEHDLKHQENTEQINFQKDLLGISATWKNAEGLLPLLKENKINVCPNIIKDPIQNISNEYKIFLAGGWKPGWSTDYVSLKLAETHGAALVLKITDIDVVKNIRPQELLNLSSQEKEMALQQAQNLPSMSWGEMRYLVGSEWKPGLHTPLDPKAAEAGFQCQPKLCIGKIKEMEKMILGEIFQGTVVNA